MEEVREMMGNHPVYISFDIDALDPSFAPGTGMNIKKYEMSKSLLSDNLEEIFLTSFKARQLPIFALNSGTGRE